MASDFGDEFGNEFKQQINQIVQLLIREKAYDHRMHKHHQEAQQSRVAHPNNMQDEVMHCTFPTEKESQYFTAWLQEQGIWSKVVDGTTVVCSAKDLTTLKKRVEELVKELNTPATKTQMKHIDSLHKQGVISDAELEALGSEPSKHHAHMLLNKYTINVGDDALQEHFDTEHGNVEVDPGHQGTKAESIKSHDGGDVDNRTHVVESVTKTVSWKDDLLTRIREARAASDTPEQFEKQCRERGVLIRDAANGDYQFYTPAAEHRCLNGRTIGKEFTREGFSERGYSLREEEERAAKMQTAMNAHEKEQAIDRAIHSWQDHGARL